MKRAIDEIIDPGPTSIDPLWDYFDSRCAYCDTRLVRGDRDAHTDHAERDGGNHIGNLVLACGRCNGDEKRDMDWRTFLELKAPDKATFDVRETRIVHWMLANPKPMRSHGPEVEELRAHCEGLVEEFRVACIALQDAVKRPGQGPHSRQMSRAGQAWPEDSPEAAVIAARRKIGASWTNLRKGVRSLLDVEHEEFGTTNVRNSSRSHVHRISRETGLSLPTLMVLFDRLGQAPD
jgi:5-methylcytosine-specific restriction endonuclease McrA